MAGRDDWTEPTNVIPNAALWLRVVLSQGRSARQCKHVGYLPRGDPFHWPTIRSNDPNLYLPRPRYVVAEDPILKAITAQISS